MQKRVRELEMRRDLTGSYRSWDCEQLPTQFRGGSGNSCELSKETSGQQDPTEKSQII